MRRLLCGVGAALMMVAVSACSGDSEPADTAADSASVAASEDAAPTRPTLTAPKLQPPEQEGRWVNEDRPDVAFDPCTWISDEAIGAAGFDPASRERGEDFVAEWTFLICRFDSNSDLIYLSVMSGNVSLDEEKQKNGSWQRPTTVNGREATIGMEPNQKDSCTVNIRTEAGVVFVEQSASHKGLTQGVDPCMGIEKTAALIEPEIGDRS